jgi:hypothetical protein
MSAGTAFGYYGVHNFHETASTRDAIGRSHLQINMTTDEPSTVDEWYTLWQSGFFDGTFDRSMPFPQINEAFDILARREALKLVLEMG